MRMPLKLGLLAAFLLSCLTAFSETLLFSPPVDEQLAPLPAGYSWNSVHLRQAGVETNMSSAIMAMSVSSVPSRIQEMAQSLENNPVRIYEYVRNRIDSVFYVGHWRSPEIVIRDGCGNDSDQAALLVALFNAAGVDAWYRCGMVTMPVNGTNHYSLASMIGVTNSIQAFNDLRARQMAVYPGDDVVTNLYYTWVAADIAGETIQLDPFFKPYNQFDGMGLSKVINGVGPG